MATVRVASTRHHHTVQFSGILTGQYLPGPYLERDRRMGKTKVQNGSQTTSYGNNTLRKTASKQQRI